MKAVQPGIKVSVAVYTRGIDSEPHKSWSPKTYKLTSGPNCLLYIQNSAARQASYYMRRRNIQYISSKSTTAGTGTPE